MGIAQQDLHALLATQLLLVAALHTKLADVVAGLVVVVLLNIGRRHLGDITKDVGCQRILVLADGALLDIEARKTEHLFLEYREVLVRELAHEELLRKARITGILAAVLDGFHAVVELLAGDVEALTQLQRVEAPVGLVHDDHDVVGWLVVHQQLAVAVGDDTA